jgi:hypothetical protein
MTQALSKPIMEKHPTSLKFFLIFFYPLKINNLQKYKYDALRHS